MRTTTSSTRSLIFQVTLDAARRAIAQQPLTFTVANAIHGCTAIVATVRGGHTGRPSHRFVASGPIAKNLRVFSCCVTTRGSAATVAAAWPSCGTSSKWHSAFAAAVLPRRVAGVLQERPNVSAAAWLPASDATPSGIQVLGNSVGCAAAPETSARSLCEDKFAIPAANLWHVPGFLWYAEFVPWEVMTPLGPPGEDRFILLGPSALNALSLSVAIGLQPCATSRGM